MSIWKQLRGKMDQPTQTPSASYRAPTGIPSPDKTRDLVLYKYDSCPYCRRVMRQVSALGLRQVKVRDILLDHEARQTLHQRTGRGTVPCLFVDDVPFFQSADINRWLEVYAAHQATP